MESSIRRYDIDWLRVIAIGLLLIYHVAIPFQPWGMFFGFIKSDQNFESVWTAMSLINIWRIPLLFFVSGMGVYFSMKRRNLITLFKERSLRILFPFIIGIFTIVPLQMLLLQYYYEQDFSYFYNPAHLWFLGNIFTYVLILVPIFYLFKKNEDKWILRFSKLLNHPVKLILLSIPFIVSVELIKPDTFTYYAMNLHGYMLGFFAFLFGYLFVFVGEVFWNTVKKWRWQFLLMGLGLYILRITYFELESPLYLMAIESLVWIYAFLGLGYMYLNIESPYLKYLSEAAYPVYIIHWIFIHLGAIILFSLGIPVAFEFLALVVFTIFGSLLCYHFVIRNVKFIRPFFGLKI